MAESRSKLRGLLRAALALPGEGHGDIPQGLAALLSRREPRAAAVLVGVVTHATGPTILFTRRTDHLAEHAGQVSFPGGRIEVEDADAVAAALREAEEETGLTRTHIEVIGILGEYRTVTNYRVVPVVALVDPGVPLTPHADEVAEVFEVPLATLRAPGGRQRRRRGFMGVEVEYWVFEHGGPPIWGATAAMLVDLCERLDRVTGAGQ